MSNNTWLANRLENNTDEELIRECVNDSLIGSVNHTCNLQENTTENQRILRAISDLKRCNYKTPIKQIADDLTAIFGAWSEKPSHWTFVAERYTPKAIKSVLNAMNKRKENGGMSLKCPGAYFYKVLKDFHPPRHVPKPKFPKKEEIFL